MRFIVLGVVLFPFAIVGAAFVLVQFGFNVGAGMMKFLLKELK